MLLLYVRTIFGRMPGFEPELLRLSMSYTHIPNELPTSKLKSLLQRKKGWLALVPGAFWCGMTLDISNSCLVLSEHKIDFLKNSKGGERNIVGHY